MKIQNTHCRSTMCALALFAVIGTSSPLLAADVDTTSIGFACGRLIIRNDGAIAWPGQNGLTWSCGPDPSAVSLYQASLVIAADSGVGGAVFRSTLEGFPMLVHRPAPYSDSGTFDVWRNVNLGAARVGGCPGFPDSIEGEIVTSRYADSVGPEYGLPQSAGIDVVQTVIATSEDPYGDFVCHRWEIVNRDPVAKGPWHAGTFADWDLASGSSNTGRFTDLANGYFIWDPSDASYACGMIDPDQKSEYQGADPMTAPPYRIWVDDVNPCATFSIGCWGFPWESAQNWNRVVRQLPLRINEGLGPTDLGGLLINPPVNLPPNGSAVIHQVLFHVDASSNNASTIEANAVALAARAARWTGFARGDVNDDGYVDLADVCWLNAGLPIYPADYCADVDVDGDVDAQDQTYLLAFVSGNGPAPAGAWRFGIPPAGP